MQQGLNIGIGSWIDAQHENGGRPAFPVNAIPFKLRHLSDLSTPEDLVRAAELSLLANRMDDGNWMHGSSGVPEYLWERHRAILGDIVTAISSLTQAERDALVRADAVLFQPDGFTISDRFAMYNETRKIHEDMVIAGGSPGEVLSAYQNWVILGHKDVIEEALAVKMNLGRGSSRIMAADDISRIEVALDSLGGDVPFAPTLFAPISASSTEHWIEAEVDFQALEDAIRPEVPRDAWRRFRGRKTGKVRFRFIAVDLIRPWFSTMLFVADDWHLADDQEMVVADGQGREGRLPAFYSRLYMAQVLEVRNDTVRLQPPPVRLGTVVFRPPTLSVGSVVARPSPVRIANRPSVLAAAGAKRSMAATPPTARRGVTQHQPGAGAKPAILANPVVAPLPMSRLDTVPHFTTGTAGRIAKIQKLTAVSAISKLNFAQAQLTHVGVAAHAPASTQEPTTYLVGFGRTNLPACPNPNPNYQWP
jgi:hypothetical protein